MTTADDTPYSVALNIDAPPSPEYTLELAEALAEVVRTLNHATRHHEALEYPSQADTLIRYLSSAVSRLPQLLGQVAGWVNAEYAADRIEMTCGEFMQPALAGLAVEARLRKAAEQAEALRGMLDAAAAVTSAMAARREDGDDE